MSKIEWTGRTWNPVRGCIKVSPGCKNCYAERQAKRLQRMGLSKYAAGFAPTVHKDDMELPLTWPPRELIFVCSMSDLMLEDFPDDIVEDIIHTMWLAGEHRFQVLTKRPERLVDFSWPANVWIGTSVESPDYYGRIDMLRESGSWENTRWLSLEPLLEPMPDLADYLQGIDWVVAGGESGPGARPMDPAWVREIRDICVAEDVPFHFKQWGGVNKKKTGRLLDGRTWDQWPAGFRPGRYGMT